MMIKKMKKRLLYILVLGVIGACLFRTCTTAEQPGGMEGEQRGSALEEPLVRSEDSLEKNDVESPQPMLRSDMLVPKSKSPLQASPLVDKRHRSTPIEATAGEDVAIKQESELPEESRECPTPQAQAIAADSARRTVTASPIVGGPTPVSHRVIHLSTNMLYDVALVPNVGIEYAFAPQWSARVHGLFAWWSNDARHRYWRVAGGSAELRYWLESQADADGLRGHHIGVYAGAYTYDFEFGGSGQMADFNYSVGLSYGYSIPLAHRLSLDMGLSVGYIGGSYIKYNYADGCYIWQSDMRRRYVGLTRAEVALVWNIDFAWKGGKP